MDLDSTGASRIGNKLHAICGLFDAMPEKLWRDLCAVASLRALRPGQELLTQGQLNDSLYVLTAGRLCVQVDREPVARLDRQGDLIGEISVVTAQPCSATVVAETDAEVVAIRAFHGATTPLRE